MNACSCRLSPALLNVAIKADDMDQAEAIGLLDCIECGTCSFVCPSHIQLVQRFRVGKQLLRAKSRRRPRVPANKLLLSSSPNAFTGADSRKIMLAVIIALLPTAIYGVVLYGLPALFVILTSVLSAVLAEAGFRKLTGQESRVGDLSAVVTGLLVALIAPPSLPLWMAALGSAAAIIFAKEFFGGLGANPFNPALIGRAILLMSFPAAMTTWHAPFGALTDATASATPLNIVKMGGTIADVGMGIAGSSDYGATCGPCS
jgi:ferredoxin